MSFLFAGLVAGAGAQSVSQLTIHADQPGHAISPTFYGLMTEEINHAYDGGLYAELIRNRALMDRRDSTPGWSLIQYPGHTGSLSLEPAEPNQPFAGKSLKLTIDPVSKPTGPLVGVANDGFWGIPIRPSTRYRASFIAKAAPGYTGGLAVTLENVSGSNVLAVARVRSIGAEWSKYSFTLSTDDSLEPMNGRIVFAADQPGTLWLTQCSLMPPTVHNRPNGTRVDLMQLMSQLTPSFLRLPGGNYLEGNTLDERFNWKTTIGPTELRPGHQGPWGYRSSDGLGLLEFLEWCEDLKMQPLLAVFAGYALNHTYVKPGPDLEPYVQDALDEIEYVTGDPKTKWGAARAKDGHPKPFPLKYVEIGNEDMFDGSGSYEGRFAQFYDAIKAKYPTLQMIATRTVTSRTPDVVDDHYYRSARDMAADSTHYDKASRTGPKIFVGEWASVEGNPTPTMQAALGDAAWLTGLERDSDLVVMESYAPLLVNVNPGAAQWGTNLIGYDGLSSYGSPSFYVQSLFGQSTGDLTVPYDLTEPTASAPDPTPHGTWRTESEFKDIEVTHDGQTLYSRDFSKGGSDWEKPVGTWDLDEGAFRQTSHDEGTLAYDGDKSWTNYTYHLKARKVEGDEGFMVMFHVRDDQNFWQWNVGGWNDSRSSIQRIEDGSAQEVGRPSRTTVTAGQWYDLRVEIVDGTIKCYVDGKLTNQAVERPRPPVEPLYAAISRSSKTGELFVKVVNISAQDQAVQLNIQGADVTSPDIRGWLLKGDPGAVNTVRNPTRVAPEPIIARGASGKFTMQFPAHSVSVFRLKSRK